MVGGGGREHAIARKIRKDAEISGREVDVFVAPGNPGIEEYATCVPIGVEDIEGLLGFALSEGIGLTIVGPEVPLVLGIVDRFEEEGLRIFGPNKAAAQIESSKSYAKFEMLKSGVPTAHYDKFTDLHSAMKHLHTMGPPIVIKADGLAAGKGVTVARTMQEGEQALRQLMMGKAHNGAGETVILEQFLLGDEISVMAFVDKSGYKIMPAVRDHKPVNDNDQGPNTGGMGTYSPVYTASPHIMKIVDERIFRGITEQFKRSKMTYRGVLFAGIIVLNNMPFVIEFNARFGDPETQVALELLDSDLIDIIDAVLEDRVASMDIEWSQDASMCIVLTAAGYPNAYRKGDVIEGLDEVKQMDYIPPLPEPIPLPVTPAPEPERTGLRKLLDYVMQKEPPKQPEPQPPVRRVVPPIAYPLHAGTARNEQGKIVTNGGRVINVVSHAATLKEAHRKAYEGAFAVKFNGRHFRGDIGTKG